MPFQQAVVIVKPHIEFDFPGRMYKITNEAIARYHEVGLNIIAVRKIMFGQKETEEFCAEHTGKPFFPLLVEAQTMGPCIAMIVGGENAIEKIRKIHGPTNPPDCRPDQLRKIYGRDERGRPFNGFHCTATPEEFEQERKIAFEMCEVAQ